MSTHPVATERELDETTNGQLPAAGHHDTTSFVVRPGPEHWPTVVAAAGRLLRDRTGNDDLVADVEAVLSRVLWEFLRHPDTHGVIVEVGVDDRSHAVVEVSAGLSDRAHDLIHALPRSGLTPPAAEEGEHTRTLRVLDALSYSWGTRRRHRKTTLRFTVRATPGSEVDLGRVGHARGEIIDAVHSATDAPPPRRPTTVDSSTVARDAVTAASRAAYAAEHARVDRAARAAEAARSVAETAAGTLQALRRQLDERAAGVAAVAAAAADQARRSAILDGDIDQAAVIALRVASAVAVSAAMSAEEASAAAVLVADAVTAAADGVAAATATAARAAEIEVENAATALRMLTAIAAERRADHDALERVVLERHERDTATTLDQLLRTNQRLRERMHRIDARALPPRTPVPDPPPAPDGLTIAVHSVGGLGSDQAGAHWYDACVTPSGVTVLIVGCTVPAAGWTADDARRVRHMLLALAVDGDGTPTSVVERLQRCVEVLGLETEIALTIAHVCPPEGDAADGRVVHWCGVGSPAPLVVDRAGGVTSPHGEGSPTLRAPGGRHPAERPLTMSAGSTVLLRSAGLLGVADDHDDLSAMLRTVDFSATEDALETVAAQTRWRRPDARGTLLAATSH